MEKQLKKEIIVVKGDNNKELIFNREAFHSIPTFKHAIEPNFLGEGFRLPLAREYATLYKCAIEDQDNEQFFNLSYTNVSYPSLSCSNHVVDKILGNTILWDFYYTSWLCNTALMYVLKGSPYDGVWIVDFPEVTRSPHGPYTINLSYEDIPKLEKRLKDSSVKHIPFGFKTGYMEPEEFEENPFIIALIGEVNASALAKYCKDSPWYRKIKPFLSVSDKSRIEKDIENYGPKCSVDSNQVVTIGGTGGINTTHKYHLQLSDWPVCYSGDARGVKEPIESTV